MNVWNHWQRRLAGEMLPLVNEQPECGFYRMKNRYNGVPTPVAYWPSGSEVHCRIGGEDVSVEKGQEVWSWCAKYPITEEAYRAVAEQGKPWPDIDPIADEQARHRIGGNNPPDEAVIIRVQIDTAIAGIGPYSEVTSDEHAAQAQTLRSRLLELRAEAEKHHKAEKQPYLDAGREVDNRWLPLAKLAQGAADAVRAALSVWETLKLRRQREAEAAAEAARIAAAPAGKPVPPPPPPAPAPTAKIKGAIGKAASSRAVLVVTVMDFDAVYQNFRQNVELQRLLTALAQTAVDRGHPVPGIKVTEEMRVKRTPHAPLGNSQAPPLGSSQSPPALPQVRLT